MPLAPPPAALGGFPSRRPGASLRRLFRIYRHRDRMTGAVNGSPWRFGAVPPGRGRFDLPAPDGTCYWSDRRYGAWVEVWRGATTIDLVDARARRLWTAQAPPLRLANLLSPRSYRYGITAAISTQPDYACPSSGPRAARRRVCRPRRQLLARPRLGGAQRRRIRSRGHAAAQRGWTTTSGPHRARRRAAGRARLASASAWRRCPTTSPPSRPTPSAGRARESRVRLRKKRAHPYGGLVVPQVAHGRALEHLAIKLQVALGHRRRGPGLDRGPAGGRIEGVDPAQGEGEVRLGGGQEARHALADQGGQHAQRGPHDGDARGPGPRSPRWRPARPSGSG